jgi:hypothetical protein
LGDAGRPRRLRHVGRRDHAHVDAARAYRPDVRSRPPAALAAGCRGPRGTERGSQRAGRNETALVA